MWVQIYGMWLVGPHGRFCSRSSLDLYALTMLPEKPLPYMVIEKPLANMFSDNPLLDMVTDNPLPGMVPENSVPLVASVHFARRPQIYGYLLCHSLF